jgi:hypothetical protein
MANKSNRKSGPGTAPKASGSPWKYGREAVNDADYSADYSRKASTSRASAGIPFRPSSKKSVPLFKGNKDRSGI